MTMPQEGKLSQGTKVAVNEVVRSISYGNGYEQRVVIGENQQSDRWNVLWNTMNVTERDEVFAFYREHGRHKSFTWTAFGDSIEKKWVFSGTLNETPLSGDLFKLTTGVRQVFDL